MSEENVEQQISEEVIKNVDDPRLKEFDEKFKYLAQKYKVTASYVLGIETEKGISFPIGGENKEFNLTLSDIIDKGIFFTNQLMEEKERLAKEQAQKAEAKEVVSKIIQP